VSTKTHLSSKIARDASRKAKSSQSPTTPDRIVDPDHTNRLVGIFVEYVAETEVIAISKSSAEPSSNSSCALEFDILGPTVVAVTHDRARVKNTECFAQPPAVESIYEIDRQCDLLRLRCRQAVRLRLLRAPAVREASYRQSSSYSNGGGYYGRLQHYVMSSSSTCGGASVLTSLTSSHRRLVGS
jgi:hypothetical protein